MKNSNSNLQSVPQIIAKPDNIKQAREAIRAQKAKTIVKIGMVSLVLGILYIIMMFLRFDEAQFAAIARMFFASIIIIPINIILLIVCIVMMSRNHIESIGVMFPAVIGIVLPILTIGLAMIL